MVLIDAVVAIAVLTIILVPITYLVITNQTTITSYRYQSIAQQLATESIESVRLQAGQATTWPPASASPVGIVTGTTACLSAGTCDWPTTFATFNSGNYSTSGTQPTIEYVGNTRFAVTVAGGWCAAGASGTTPAYSVWTQNAASGAELAYLVAVRVVWTPRGGADALTDLVQDGVVASQPQWVRGPVTATAACPTTLSRSATP